MDKLDKFINKLHGMADANEQLQTAFYFVRDIPYGTIGSHEIADAIDSNRANCHAKSQLLSHLFQSLCYETRIVVMQYRLKDYPAEVRAIPGQLDYHYVPEVLLHGTWVYADATYDPLLARFGFVVNEWDGKTSTALAELPIIQKVEGQPDEIFDRTYASFQTLLSDAYTKHGDEIHAYQLKFNAWLAEARRV